MKTVIVPNVLRDAINKALDAAILECPEAEKERAHLYDCLLKYYDENGHIPEFTIAKSDQS